MSTILTLYASESGKVAKIIKDKDVSVLDQMPDAESKSYLNKIFDHEYERDPDTYEHPEGDKYIFAFHELCKMSATKSTSIECSVDDEQTPEFWHFVWSDWEPEDFLELPLSPDGLPAVTYKDSTMLQKYIDQLKGVEANGGYDSRFLKIDDLREIISFLQDSTSAGTDVFVFISE